jgi:2-polyprenyl-3-methyl-5-hydroxy-6-metoxy-1,4-benzoquinol methylase
MRGIEAHLYPRIRACRNAPVRLLDLGAGGCTIPASVARWARQKSIPLHIVALDLHQTHLQWARQHVPEGPAIACVQGDALALPFAEGCVDFVISSLFLHHFSAEVLIQMLPRWVYLARRSLIMIDLVRHPLPYWFIKATSPVFARSGMTRHDAVASIRRAYRPQELQSIVAAAGFAQARVYTYFPYRMTLVIDHPALGAT